MRAGARSARCKTARSRCLSAICCCQTELLNRRFPVLCEKPDNFVKKAWDWACQSGLSSEEPWEKTTERREKTAQSQDGMEFSHCDPPESGLFFIQGRLSLIQSCLSAAQREENSA